MVAVKQLELYYLCSIGELFSYVAVCCERNSYNFVHLIQNSNPENTKSQETRKMDVLIQQEAVQGIFALTANIFVILCACYMEKTIY